MQLTNAHFDIYELGGADVPRLGADDPRNIGVARALVFVVREDPKDLREIFGVDGTIGGSVEATYGNYNAVTLKGDITGPIGEGVAFSLDGSYNRRDGYGEIVNLGKDISDRNRWSARGQLLIEPTADLKIRAIADYSKIDEVCCVVSTLVAGPSAAAIVGVGGGLSTDFFSYDTYLNQEPINKVDNYGGSVQVDWDRGSIGITSITAYRELKNFVDQDVDFTSADIVRERRDQRVKTFTQVAFTVIPGCLSDGYKQEP